MKNSRHIAAKLGVSKRTLSRWVATGVNCGELQELAENTYLRPSAVARALGVHRGTIYRWFHEGLLGGVKFAKTIRISSDSVERLLAASRSADSLAGE